MDRTSIEVIPLTSSLSENELRFAMGIPAEAPLKRRLARLFPEVLAAIETEARPRLLWRLETSATWQTLLRPSRRLSRYLALPERAAVVAATVGTEWEAFIAAEGDPMRQYLYAAAGTALARSTLVKARRELAHRFPEAQIADSLSPGTDGLPLAIQADLSEVIPLSEIGIELNPETFWMRPLSSVTALIAFGSAVEREIELPLCGEAEPRCPSCGSPRCALRVSPRRSNRDATAIFPSAETPMPGAFARTHYSPAL